MFNARSVCANLCDLHYLLDSGEYDVIMITETWLKPVISDGLIDPSRGYNVIRRDRLDSTGGGVCILLRKSVHFSEITISENVEILAVDVCVSQVKHRLIVVYRPPYSEPTDKLYAVKLINVLSSLSLVTWPVFIGGDFNCPGISWDVFKAPADNIQDLLLDFALSNGFSQLVNEPTRQDNILDLVLCNEPLLITSVDIQSPVGKSDHASVTFQFSTGCSPSYEPECSEEYDLHRIYRWKDADYDSMNNYLSTVDWQSMLMCNLTVDALWSALTETLQSAVDRYVPFYTVRQSGKFAQHGKRHKYPRYIQKAISRKKCLWRLHRKNPADVELRCRYKVAHDECRKLVREYILTKEKEVIDADNLGKFYRFVNNKMTCKSGVGTLRDNDHKLVVNDKQKADLLNNFFATVGSDDDGNDISLDREVPDNVRLESVSFSPQVISRVIRKIEPKMSSGPDGFPPILVKKVASSLTFPLSEIFRSFMSVGMIPCAWRHGIITPVYKSGIASDPANYRPIALTSVFCKLMERVISAEILQYCKRHGLISEQQHGFLSKRSTVTNLLSGHNDWTSAISNHHSVAVAYIDFQKAFDSVCHKKLFTRLSSLGITGNLLAWIKDFLTDRQQCTRVGDVVSDTVKIISGVIQGSCLGPVLFVLYINSITKVVPDNVTCLLFADDVKIYTVLKSDVDSVNLQNALDRITDWSVKWQMPISIKKCSVIIYGKSAITTTPYYLCGSRLKSTDVVKDLGVTMNCHLQFTGHVNCIVGKAHSRAYLIRKCFISRNPPILMRAFNTYVRPVLEYASSVWSPQYNYLIDKVESVQRRFTKRLPGYSALDYPTRLTSLEQYSLEKRRIVHDLVLAYKFVFRLVDVQTSNFFTLRNDAVPTRGNPYKVLLNTSRVNVRRHFFTERIALIWNSLPPNVVDYRSLSSFKRTINNGHVNLFTRY